MKTLFSAFDRRIGNPELETRVVRWIVPALSLATIYLMAVLFPQVAKDRAELSLSILGAFLLFLLMSFGITLLIPLQKAASEGRLRSRRAEYLGYVVGASLFIVGVRSVPGFGFVSEGDIRVGLLLLSSTCGAIVSLGMMTSLAKAAKS
jgi:hypothetical protein